MKKRSWILAVAAALALCTGAFAAEKVFVYNLGVEPRTIDPALNNAVDGSTVIYNIFEGLVRISFEDKPEPGLAESWDVSDDSLTWTFHLRDGLKWHDGTPLTAEHFRYGFMRVIDPNVASPYAYLAFPIVNAENYYNGKCAAEDVGITVIDDKTLEIKLAYQNPLMLDHFSYHIFFPAKPEVVEAHPREWTTSPDTILCNGPFYLTEWKHNAEMTLTKNPNYWDADNVKIDKVRMVMIADANTCLAAFKGGRLDFTTRLPSMQIPMLLKSGQAKSAKTLGVSFSVFNITQPPFDNPLVRKAFALAIDRQGIVDKVTMGGQAPANAFIPYGLPGPEAGKDFRASGKSYFETRAKVEEARALLAEAGYPGGAGFPKVVYKYNTNEGNKNIAEALQAMWKRNLGVEVELYNEEWKVFINTRNQKDYQIARHAYLVDFFDPASLFELFVTDSAENVTGYSDEEYDRLVIAARSEMDSAKRLGYLLQAEEILMRDMPLLPINYYATPYMVSPRTKGLYISPRNWDFFRGVELQ